MDPRWLFPLLALAFATAAAWQRMRSGSFRGAARTWLWMAFAFAAVSVWLHASTPPLA